MRTLLRKWLGVTDLDARTLDVERHFITRRNPETGQVLKLWQTCRSGNEKSAR